MNSISNTSTPSMGGNTCISDEEYLSEMIGAKRAALPLVIFLTVIYCCIFLVGIFGNVTTCFVIGRIRFMHTPTNVYLLNLSISDLTVLILGLPHDLVYYWQRYPYMFTQGVCKLKNTLAEISMCSSVFTVVAFTVERYIAICHPIRYADSENIFRAVKVVVFIWLISSLVTLPYIPLVGIRYNYRNDSTTNFIQKPLLDSTTCSVVNETLSNHAFVISFVALFFIPLCVISFLYIRIGLAIRNSLMNRRLSDTLNGTPNQIQSTVSKIRAKKAVLKMLVAVVVAFFVCFAPFHAERLMVSLIPSQMWDENQKLYQLHDILYYISGIFYFTSTIVNPILYNLLSLKFRKASRHVLLHCCECIRSNQRREHIQPSANFRYPGGGVGGGGNIHVLQNRYSVQHGLTNTSRECCMNYLCCRFWPCNSNNSMSSPFSSQQSPHINNVPCAINFNSPNQAQPYHPPALPLLPHDNRNRQSVAIGDSQTYPLRYHAGDVIPVRKCNKNVKIRKDNKWKPLSCPPLFKTSGPFVDHHRRHDGTQEAASQKIIVLPCVSPQNHIPLIHLGDYTAPNSTGLVEPLSCQFRGCHSLNYWTCHNVDMSSSTESAGSSHQRDIHFPPCHCLDPSCGASSTTSTVGYVAQKVPLLIINPENTFHKAQH